ncbi:MAG: hypothetical protein WD512_19015 [Candidatus Paceibacterota bacterium]
MKNFKYVVGGKTVDPNKHFEPEIEFSKKLLSRVKDTMIVEHGLSQAEVNKFLDSVVGQVKYKK